MINLFLTATRVRIVSLGLGLLILPVLFACGGDGESAQAEGFEPDSVLGAILESAARNQAPAPPLPGPSTSPRVAQVDQPLQIETMGYNFGSSEALVKVLEISDFGCGYCRRFHEEIFPELEKIYMDGGFVEWKFIPFVLGMFPNGLQAATAGECAGEQDHFYTMQSRLFAEQSGWRDSSEPYVFFSNLAAEEGLDVERFESCIEGGWRSNQLSANIRLGQQAGVRGTPLFLIDGRPLHGAVPLEDFRSIIDLALRQRGVTPPPQ